MEELLTTSIPCSQLRSIPALPNPHARAGKCQGFPISERIGQLCCCRGEAWLPFQKLPATSCLASCQSPSWKLGPPCPQPRAPIFPLFRGGSANLPWAGPLLLLMTVKV